MADYSDFPFDAFTADEIAQMFLSSTRIDDREFAAACREQLKRRCVEEGDRKVKGESDGKK